MEAANHLGFIVAAYAAAGAVVGGLVGWVMLDYRAQQRNLADLEKRGIMRRGVAGSEPAAEQAKEDA
jgi:heme exporter protein CcmD